MILAFLFTILVFWVGYRILKFFYNILIYQTSCSDLKQRFATEIEIIKETKKVVLSKYMIAISSFLLIKIIYEHIAAALLRVRLLSTFKELVPAILQESIANFEYKIILAQLFFIVGALIFPLIIIYTIQKICFRNQQGLPPLEFKILSCKFFGLSIYAFLIVILSILLALFFIFGPIILLTGYISCISEICEFFGSASTHQLKSLLASYLPEFFILFAGIFKFAKICLYTIAGKLQTNPIVYQALTFMVYYFSIRFGTRAVSNIYNYGKVNYFYNSLVNNVPQKVLMKLALIFTLQGIINNCLGYSLNYLKMLIMGTPVDEYSEIIKNDYGIVTNFPAHIPTHCPLVCDFYQLIFITIPIIITCFILYKKYK